MRGKPNAFRCLRCGHEWWSFLERPTTCPQCKHYHWDTPGKPRQPRQPAGAGKGE